MGSNSGKRRGARKKYSDAFKRKVAQEYLSSPEETLKSIAKRHGLPSMYAVKDFLKWYEKQPQEIAPPAPLSEAEQQEVAALQKRIKELEKQLSHEQLRALGFETMIDIAEKELKIDIRKKSDTKQ